MVAQHLLVLCIIDSLLHVDFPHDEIWVVKSFFGKIRFGCEGNREITFLKIEFVTRIKLVDLLVDCDVHILSEGHLL